MKYLKNLFQSKYFKPIISVFFVAVASIFTGYFIVNGANYMSSNFLNIDSGGAYIYGNPTGNGLIVANGNIGIGKSPSYKLDVDGPARVNNIVDPDDLKIAGGSNGNYVGIFGGGGTSPSANEGAAVYVRGRWDTTGPIPPSPGGQAGIFQVFTPNTSAVGVERFRIESGDNPNVRVYDNTILGNSGANITTVNGKLTVSGSVGIWTTSPDPAVRLHVAGGGIGLDNNQSISAKTSLGTMSEIMRLDGTNKLHIRGVAGGFQINDSGGNSLVFVSNEGVMRLTPTDNPGACNAAARGSIYFDNSVSKLCECDGSFWRRVSNPTFGC